MQRCHDCEFNALVASPLPIVLVVSSELELRREGGRVANRNNGLACSLVRIFPSNALQLISPLSLRLWVFPAAHNAKVDTWFPGGCIRNRQLGFCKRNRMSFRELVVRGN